MPFVLKCSNQVFIFLAPVLLLQILFCSFNFCVIIFICNLNYELNEIKRHAIDLSLGSKISRCYWAFSTIIWEIIFLYINLRYLTVDHDRPANSEASERKNLTFSLLNFKIQLYKYE